MSFRILNQAPQYLLADGSVNAGGSLTFYATDLTTPKNTWSNAAKTVLNPNPVVLDAAGRSNTDIWGDGEYGVVCKDALGVVQWTRNNVRDASGSSTTIPALQTGKFLTNDGAVLQWEPVVQVPDMTGESGNILSNDGANPTWIPMPEVPKPDIELTANTMRIGDFLIQWGTENAPASGTFSTSKAVTFPKSFSSAPFYVKPSVTAVRVTSSSLVADSASGATLTGVTFNFVTADSKEGNSERITSPVPFNWIAFGKAQAQP